MDATAIARIEDHFRELTDPRRRKATYPLINIVTITLCAVISGADDFVAITLWAKAKKEWLARFLDLSAGIPSHDRFNAVLGAIKPAEFEKCFLNWITALHEIPGSQNIAWKTIASRLPAAVMRPMRKATAAGTLAKLPEDFPLKEKWPGVAAIGMACRVTEHKNGKQSDEIRLYITSCYMSGEKFAAAVRGHGGIENSLHWQLDVTFGARPVPRSQGARRCEPQHPSPHRTEPLEKQQRKESRREEQATRCCHR